MDELSLTVFDNDDEHRATVLRTLASHMDDSHRWSTGGTFRQLFISLCASDETVYGGVLAYTHSEWLEIEFIWVAEVRRGCGLGTRMIAAAEHEARGRGCQRAYLDTGTSPFASFFLHRGYQVCGELLNYHAGAPRLWLTKSLS